MKLVVNNPRHQAGNIDIYSTAVRNDTVTRNTECSEGVAPTRKHIAFYNNICFERTFAGQLRIYV